MNAALESFCHWEQPWKYIDTVVTNAALQDDEVEVVNTLWREATRAEHWSAPGTRRPRSGYAAICPHAHPWLSTGAINAFVRAASYDWK